ncbi:DUF2846 domain-containing protein [Limnobaculum zhutongyuii]|uniref:DUF2846 domain-containing protein n=1 Tax=Limnobaculum zhutongyuii TaxID=2498113 RepID=A0A411WJG7_9GAMM|nr:DUF2846 domain-containing protein [Limnobaculum zhutongyuii]QBH96343.1 DUF2846 domain-containing protein [Limnobaculum zhutongyuii]TQS87068.1 DUF2846 domain-containing protein [Limnobaculum zhutongyuii]
MNIKSLLLSVSLLSILLLSGCNSTVPLANDQESAITKSFPVPQENQSALYIYRDSFTGKALKKDIYVDDKCVGETADKTFFYTLVAGNQTHKISTESEFSPNDLSIFTEPGKNYFIRQHIRMGVFVGGAKLSVSSEEEGKRVITKADVHLAEPGVCDN